MNTQTYGSDLDNFAIERTMIFVLNLRGLSVHEKVVAFTLAAHATYTSDGPVHIASMVEMSLLVAETGIKDRETVSHIIKRLTELGIITQIGLDSIWRWNAAA